MSETELIATGSMDYLSGTESYAMRYFQGVLFSNSIVTLNQINGSEGLVDTIITKINNIIKWVWAKIKSIFEFVFGSKQKQVTKKGKEALADIVPEYTLKDRSGIEVSNRLKDLMYKIDATVMEFFGGINNAIRAINHLNDKTNVLLLKIEPVESYKTEYDLFKAKAFHHIDVIKETSDVGSFGNHIIDFGAALSKFDEWMLLHCPRHRCEISKSAYSCSKEELTDSLSEDIAKINDPQLSAQAIKEIMKILTWRTQILMHLNNHIPHYNSVVEDMEKNKWFEKKK